MAVEKLSGSARSREVSVCVPLGVELLDCVDGPELVGGNNACATRWLNHNRHDPKNCLFWSHGIAITRTAHVVTDSRVTFPRLGEFSAPNAEDSFLSQVFYCKCDIAINERKYSCIGSCFCVGSCQDTRIDVSHRSTECR